MILLLLNIVFNLLLNPGDKIHAEVENYIHENHAEYDSVSYSLHDEFSSIKSLEINYKRKSNRIGNNFFIPVKIIDQNNISRERFLIAKVELFKKVLISNVVINKGELINGTNSSFMLKNVTDLNQTPININEEPTGVISRLNLPPGTIICREHIHAEPVINPGDQVNLRYDFGSVSVTFIGTARQSGTVGDIVKIRANNHQYSAEIINHNEAIIIE